MTPRRRWVLALLCSLASVALNAFEAYGASGLFALLCGFVAVFGIEAVDREAP